MTSSVKYISYEYLLAINRMFTGDGTLRDVGSLASACERPRAGVYGEEAYPTIWEKAAALLQSIACNHAFVDGNKRTAWVAAVAFLDYNGHPLDWAFDQQDAEDLVLAVATGRLRDVPAIASELVKFCR